MFSMIEEKEKLAQEVEDFMKEKVKDRVDEIEESDEFPWDVAKLFFEKGFLKILVPKEYGGMGGTITDFCVICEKVAKFSGALALLVIVQTVGTLPIIIAGNDRQREEFLRRVGEGGELMAFALTEPKAGSDVGGIEMVANRVDGGYVLNGKKAFVTNGGVADNYIVFAKTDPGRGKRGISCFIVNKHSPGFIIGHKDRKIGMLGIPSTSAFFRDVFVPEDCLLGEEGEGFIIALETLNRSRPAVGAQAVGIAQAAFDLAMMYAIKRRQFGKPIAALEGMQFMLSEMAAELEAARLLVYRAAHAIDTGHRFAPKYSAMSKFYATDMAMKVTVEAVQVMGGYGCLKSTRLERFMRDAKITQIYEGTNQIQKFVVAEQLIKEYLEKSAFCSYEYLMDEESQS